jgi:Uma2 family endonuclease
MEAKKLKTFEDLQAAWKKDERLELISGKIIKRPMARYEHGAVQIAVGSELTPYKKNKGPGGWWIASEISIKYSDHHCPAHDLAGWRKERVQNKPSGVMEITPDWVCEITSPGHEKKDLLDNLLLLQKYKVPYYWIISPEDQSLIAYKLVGEKYSLIETIDHCEGSLRIEPFTEIDFDLSYIFEN